MGANLDSEQLAFLVALKRKEPEEYTKYMKAFKEVLTDIKTIMEEL